MRPEICGRCGHWARSVVEYTITRGSRWWAWAECCGTMWSLEQAEACRWADATHALEWPAEVVATNARRYARRPGNARPRRSLAALCFAEPAHA